ncbi:MAG: hypothetical protein ACKOAD_06560 [Gammaproteobacteria bacterium]
MLSNSKIDPNHNPIKVDPGYSFHTNPIKLVIQTKSYTVFSANALEALLSNDALNSNQKLMWLLLFSMAKRGGVEHLRTEIDLRYLGGSLNLKRRTVTSILDALAKNNFIHVQQDPKNQNPAKKIVLVRVPSSLFGNKDKVHPNLCSAEFINSPSFNTQFKMLPNPILENLLKDEHLSSSAKLLWLDLFFRVESSEEMTTNELTINFLGRQLNWSRANTSRAFKELCIQQYAQLKSGSSKYESRLEVLYPESKLQDILQNSPNRKGSGVSGFKPSAMQSVASPIPNETSSVFFTPAAEIGVPCQKPESQIAFDHMQDIKSFLKIENTEVKSDPAPQEASLESPSPSLGSEKGHADLRAELAEKRAKFAEKRTKFADSIKYNKYNIKTTTCIEGRSFVDSAVDDSALIASPKNPSYAQHTLEVVFQRRLKLEILKFEAEHSEIKTQPTLSHQITEALFPQALSELKERLKKGKGLDFSDSKILLEVLALNAAYFGEKSCTLFPWSHQEAFSKTPLHDELFGCLVLFDGWLEYSIKHQLKAIFAQKGRESAPAKSPQTKPKSEVLELSSKELEKVAGIIEGLKLSGKVVGDAKAASIEELIAQVHFFVSSWSPTKMECVSRQDRISKALSISIKLLKEGRWSIPCGFNRKKTLDLENDAKKFKDFSRDREVYQNLVGRIF